MTAPGRLTETVCTRFQEQTRSHQFVAPKVGIRKLSAMVVGVSMLATACGSGATNPELGAGLSSPSSEPSVVTSASDSTSDSDSADNGTATAADAGSESTDEAAAGPVAPISDHLFPDVDVVDIQTGATLNIATELAGGDRPVLLWFWAPH